MTITLKKCLSPNNKINKTFDETTLELTGNLKSGTNIMNPVIEIKSDNNIYDFNYMVISDFGRSYFINSIDALSNTIYKIAGKVDVLESYKTQLLECEAIIENKASGYNAYIDGGDIIAESRNIRTNHHFKDLEGNAYWKDTNGNCGIDPTEWSYIMIINGPGAPVVTP